MYELIRYKVYWFVLLMACLSACTPGVTNQTVTTPPNLSSVEVTRPTVAIATATLLPTDTVMPASATPVTPESTMTPTTMPFVTSTPQPTPDMLIDVCPEAIDTQGQPLWSAGSILFGTGWLTHNHADSFKPQMPGIWAISAHQLEPQLAYAIPASSNSLVFLSDDGNTLLYVDSDYIYVDGQSQEKVVFYDLRSRTEIWSTGLPSRVWSHEWLADGRVKFLVNEERTWEVGTRREYLLLDPETKQSEAVAEELSLPGYQFNDEIPPHGYASVNPSGEFVLYTATADDGVDIRLLNLLTGEILWQQNSQFLPGPYEPEWAEGGSHVLFYLGDLIEGVVYDKILRLGSDGELENLPHQPYPRLYPSTSVTVLTTSPDQRYIIYRAGWREPAGFVVDTVTSQIGEICETDATFIDGQWISDSLFVYRMLVERDGQLTHSLRVLDIPTWTTQVIFEAEPGYGVNIFGWTPVEFP